MLEEVEACAFEVGQLYELDEIRGGVVGERARHRRLDVEDVDLVPSDEIFQRLGGGGVEEISGEETEVTLYRDVELGVSVAVEELAVGLGSGAAEERARVGLEAPVEAAELGKSWEDRRMDEWGIRRGGSRTTRGARRRRWGTGSAAVAKSLGASRRKKRAAAAVEAVAAARGTRGSGRTLESDGVYRREIDVGSFLELVKQRRLALQALLLRGGRGHHL